MRKLNKLLLKHNLKKTADLPGAKVDVSHPAISDHVRGYIARGKYEAEEQSLISKTLTPEDTVLEIGAGIGYVSCVCAGILQDKDRLHVFEANPKIIPIIEENKKINNVDFHIHNQLIGFEEGEVDFYIPEDFWSASMTPVDGAEVVTIPVIDANELISSIKPTYLIMDVEGAEFDILPKLDLSNIQTICLEVHPHKGEASKVKRMFQHLLGQGFMFDFNKFDLVYLFKRVEGPAQKTEQSN